MDRRTYVDECRRKITPLYSQIENEKNKAVEKFREDLNKIGLGGYVRRKKDGKKGIIEVSKDRVSTIAVEFHPITKAGVPSKIANGYLWDDIIENSFEPWEEDERE